MSLRASIQTAPVCRAPRASSNADTLLRRDSLRQDQSRDSRETRRSLLDRGQQHHRQDRRDPTRHAFCARLPSRQPHRNARSVPKAAGRQLSASACECQSSIVSAGRTRRLSRVVHIPQRRKESPPCRRSKPRAHSAPWRKPDRNCLAASRGSSPTPALPNPRRRVLCSRACTRHARR